MVLKGPPQQLWPVHRRIVAEGQGSGLDEGMGLGEFLAGPSGTQGGHGQHAGHVLVAAVEDGLNLGGLVPAGAGRGDGGHLGETALRSHGQAVVEAFRPLRPRIPKVGLQVPPSRKGAGAAQVAVALVGIKRSIGG